MLFSKCRVGVCVTWLIKSTMPNSEIRLMLSPSDKDGGGRVGGRGADDVLRLFREANKASEKLDMVVASSRRPPPTSSRPSRPSRPLRLLARVIMVVELLDVQTPKIF